MADKICHLCLTHYLDGLILNYPISITKKARVQKLLKQALSPVEGD